MRYNASVNIEIGVQEDFQYIVTPNVQRVLGDIVSSVSTGIHSFSVIGTYGTGKSSFIMALERGLLGKDDALIKKKTVFFGLESFEIFNIVGEYDSLQGLLARKLTVENRNALDTLSSSAKKQKPRIRPSLLSSTNSVRSSNMQPRITRRKNCTSSSNFASW